MAVRDEYFLATVDAPVPREFPLYLDTDRSLKLFERLSGVEDPLLAGMSRDDASLVANWRKSMALVRESDNLVKGLSTPSFVALDRPTVIRAKQIDAAEAKARQAMALDGQWSLPQTRLNQVEQARSMLDEPDSLGSGRISGFHLGFGLEYRGGTFTPSSDFDCGMSGPSLGPDYQLGRRFALGVRWMPWSPRNSLVLKSLSLGRISAQLSYQMPIRIQLGAGGFLVESTAIWQNWNEKTFATTPEFKGKGTTYGFAIGLVQRNGYDPGRGRRIRLNMGYTWGDDFTFSSDDGATWMRYRDQVRFSPKGINVRFELGY